MKTQPLRIKKIAIYLMTACFFISLIGCGSTPKPVDKEGLRKRADQETSKL